MHEHGTGLERDQVGEPMVSSWGGDFRPLKRLWCDQALEVVEEDFVGDEGQRTLCGKGKVERGVERGYRVGKPGRMNL